MKPLNIVFLALAAFAVALFVFSQNPAIQTGGIVLVAVFLWATLLVPEFFTSIAFMALALVLGLAPPDLVLSGFQSKAIWLVFAGVIFGVAIQELELGAALFDRVLTRQHSYGTLIWMTAIFGLASSFLVPSAMGRVMLLAPMAAAFSEQNGFAAQSNERTGICLTAILSTTIPAFAILPSNVPNVVLLGASETLYGITFSYIDYLGINFPVLGLGAFMLATLLISRRFPGSGEVVSKSKDPAPWTGRQSRLMGLLLATLALWLTEDIHGIPAAWVGFGAAIVCMIPALGIIPPATIKTINLGPWFFVAGIIGLGAVARHNGLADILWSLLQNAADFKEMGGFAIYVTIVVFAMALAVLTTLPAAPSLFAPLAAPIAAETGWPLEAVLYAEIPSFLFFAFPYQAPPILVGLALLNIPLRKAMLVLVPLWLAGALVLAPLHYLWGRVMGIFP
ncbi:MAG: anion permease [Fimbriimonadaceae bacterium]|nr:anion permease [Alphaproteobacteria bacterium]